LLQMAADEMLEPEAIIVVEHDAGHHYPEQMEYFQQFKYAKYGDIAVSIYKYYNNESHDRSDDDVNE